MNAPAALEDRVRRGLHAAAEALPEAPLVPPAPGGAGRVDRSRRAGRRRSLRPRPLALAAAAAVIAIVVAALVAVTRPDGGGPDDGSDLRVASPDEADQETDPVRPANGRVPGQALVVDHDTGTSELRTYGPDGAQTGTVDLAPLANVRSAASDLDGGWVACGHDPRPGGPGRVPQLMWFPAGRDPMVVELSRRALCGPRQVQVVDAPEGPTVLYTAFRPEDRLYELRALVLATGQDRVVPLAAEPIAPRWSASRGRLLVLDDGRLQLLDLATGESLPVAPTIDVSGASGVVLAPDATSVAVLAPMGGDVAQNLVVVYDLVTGDVRFREIFPGSEGSEVSYDGTTLAVGDFYGGGGGTVTVIDLVSGARHTIDAYGTLL